MATISSQLPVDIPSLEDITGASRAAISAQSAAATLPMELRQALTSRITGEHPLVKEREESLQRAITSGPRVREELLDISRNRVPLSPTSQFAIESARKAADIIPLSTANMLLGLQFGNINDVVESGSRIAQAESTRKVQEASLLQATRQNALDELFRQAELDLKNRELAQKGAGKTDFLSLLKGLSEGTTATEPQPQYSPAKGEGATSPQGQWVFKGRQWQPVQGKAGGGLLSQLTPEMLAAGVVSGALSSGEASILGKLSGATPSAAQEKVNRQVSSIEGQINQMASLLNTIPSGGISGSLQALGALIPGVAPQARTYQALRNAFTGPVARVISQEVGVLTDRDIARAQDILPSLIDTDQERQMKLQAIKQAINNLRSGQAMSAEGQSLLSQNQDVGPTLDELYFGGGF